MQFDKLQGKGITQATREKYHSISRGFHLFVNELTRKPEKWEDRIHLYATYLMETGSHSKTLGSYMSAIKSVLTAEGHELQLNSAAIASIIKECKYKNDEVVQRLPINHNMLITLLNGVGSYFDKQPYLCTLYKAMFAAAYHGLLRVGEMTSSQHAVLAHDIIISEKKKVIHFILRTSKTHGLGDPPQIVTYNCDCDLTGQPQYCPYHLLQEFNKAKDPYIREQDQYFTFRGQVPVTPDQFRRTLKKILKHCHIQCDSYNTHSFRIGHAQDMKKEGRDVFYIKKKGRWKSSTFFSYLFRGI